MSEISFNTVPPNTRVPGFYPELDNSKANSGNVAFKSLLFASKTSEGSAIEGEIELVTRLKTAQELFGKGSDAAMACDIWFKNSVQPLWVMPVDDNSAGVAAQYAVTFSGTASGASTAAVLIAGKRFTFGIASGDDAAAVAQSFYDAIIGDANLPVTASISGDAVTFTAKNKGLNGNEIGFDFNSNGRENGEYFTGTTSVAVARSVDGAGNPDLFSLISKMGDEVYSMIILAYSDVANLNYFEEELADTETGRWGGLRKLYGHVFYGKSGSYADLITHSSARNNQHESVVALQSANQPMYLWATAAVAIIAPEAEQDPARPFQNLGLYGLTAPKKSSRFTNFPEKNLMLSSGISTFDFTSSDAPLIQRMVTAYLENDSGDADDSYLDLNTMFISEFRLRRIRSLWNSHFPRHKLAKDGTIGDNIMTPSLAENWFFARYQEDIDAGICQDMDAYKSLIKSKISADNPDRLDVLETPIYINGMRVAGLLSSFIFTSSKESA